MRLDEVSSSIASEVNAHCEGRCSLERESISRPEFLCLEGDLQVVVFRAVITKEESSGACDDVTRAMQDWVRGGGASVLVGGNRYSLDQECTAVIEVSI